MVKLTANDSGINNNSSSSNDNINNNDNINDNNSQSMALPSGQPALMTVYLAYAEDAQRQHYLALPVRAGSSLYQALAQAGWLAKFPELAVWCHEVADMVTPTAKRWHVGIYAQKQPLHYRLQPFDRIEVYRSLSADPMSQRKHKSGG